MGYRRIYIVYRGIYKMVYRYIINAVGELIKTRISHHQRVQR